MVCVCVCGDTRLLLSRAIEPVVLQRRRHYPLSGGVPQGPLLVSTISLFPHVGCLVQKFQPPFPACCCLPLSSVVERHSVGVLGRLLFKWSGQPSCTLQQMATAISIYVVLIPHIQIRAQEFFIFLYLYFLKGLCFLKVICPTLSCLMGGSTHTNTP